MSVRKDELLDNDNAAGALRDEIRDLIGHVIASGKVTTREAAGKLAAQLGLIVHYDSWTLQSPDAEEKEFVDQVRAIIRLNRAALDVIAPKAGPLLDAIERGASIQQEEAVHLIRAKHTRSYLQTYADGAADAIDSIIREHGHFLDRAAGAYLHLLGVIATQIELPERSVRGWLKHYKKLRKIQEDQDFVYPYLQACKRFARRVPGDESA